MEKGGGVGLRDVTNFSQNMNFPSLIAYPVLPDKFT